MVDPLEKITSHKQDLVCPTFAPCQSRTHGGEMIKRVCVGVCVWGGVPNSIGLDHTATGSPCHKETS